MNIQLLIVMVCVVAALAYLLRPWVARWRMARGGAQGVAAPKDGPGACGSCKACSRRSPGGCH